MFKQLQIILESFRPLFSHKAAYGYFILILLGFILRMDHYGVSSTIRWLGLDARVYDSLIHFFSHSRAWNLNAVMSHWLGWCRRSFPVVEVQGRIVLQGDHIKVPKEAQRQPGIVKLHQESDNSGKPEWFWGHHFGTVALLVGSIKKYFAVPCLTATHQGVSQLRSLQGQRAVGKETIVTQMIDLLVITAIMLEHPAYVVLDAYFSTGPAFITARQYCTDIGQPWIHLIVPAKKSYVAYLSNQTNQANRVKLWERFNCLQSFTEADHPVHQRPIRYYERILFWPPAECLFRFVWIVDGHRCWVLMGTDLTLNPLEMIRLYSLRSKIEVLFKVLTHVIGAFGYRFWTTACPKLSKKKQSTTSDLVGSQHCEKMLSTLSAIESFINFAGIVTGILQYLALTYHQQIWKLHEGSSWLRTYSSEIPSEEVVLRVIQCHFFVHPQTKALAWIRTMIQHTNRKKQIRRKVRQNGTFQPPDRRRKLT